MFLKKSVNGNLLQMTEAETTFDTYKDLVKMAPDKKYIIRGIMEEVPLVSTLDMETDVLEHQEIHSRLMKADLQ